MISGFVFLVLIPRWKRMAPTVKALFVVVVGGGVAGVLLAYLVKYEVVFLDSN
jgi:hypothetical protein